VLLPEIWPLLEVRGIPAGGQLILGLQHAGGVKARVHCPEVPEALHEQPRSAHEQHGERELGDDKAPL
jgi:hypothetical protein